MNKLAQGIIGISAILVTACASTIAQDEDHSDHMSGGGMQKLDAHLEHIQDADNNRERMLRHHIQLMKAQIEEMASMGHGGMGGGMGGMNHGEGGMGGGMGGMMQHHTDVIKMMQHIIAIEEMLLELIDD